MAIREKRGFVPSCSSEHIQWNKVEACEDNFVLITIGKIFLPDLELLSFFYFILFFFGEISFNRTKKSVYRRKVLNSHGICLEHQWAPFPCIDCRDAIWKCSILDKSHYVALLPPIKYKPHSLYIRWRSSDSNQISEFFVVFNTNLDSLSDWFTNSDDHRYAPKHLNSTLLHTVWLQSIIGDPVR